MKKRFVLIGGLLACTLVTTFTPSCTPTANVEEEITQTADYGIQFNHDSWADIVKKAKAENKLIFVDFYTQWCGPCYNMAKSVFTQPNVGAFYNKNFVCAKIDTENGEGVELAKKYRVRSFPTYVFIDPTTEEAVHRSQSRQTDQQFIYTGQSAINPTKRSVYLDENYQKGNREAQFLIDYITYYSSIFASKNVNTAFEELMKGGAKLTDKKVWDVFDLAVQGVTPYLKEVSDNYDQYCKLYGKEVVDAKLSKETQYGDLEAIENLCEYEDKALNCEFIRINLAVREKKYDEAIRRIDGLIANKAMNQQKVIDKLKYVARINPYYSDEMPDNWYFKCVEYVRYIAYNNQDRENANVHFEYAAALEDMMKRVAKSGKKIPAYLLKAPTYGNDQYNMRPHDLKFKPGYKKRAAK